MTTVGTYVNLDEVQKMIGSFVNGRTKKDEPVSGLFIGFNRWGDATVVSIDGVEHPSQVETLDEVSREDLNEKEEAFVSDRVMEIRSERLRYVLRTLPKKYHVKSILS